MSDAKMRPGPSRRRAALSTSPPTGSHLPRPTHAGAGKNFYLRLAAPALAPRSCRQPLSHLLPQGGWEQHLYGLTATGATGAFAAAAPGPRASGNPTCRGHSVSLRGRCYSMVPPPIMSLSTLALEPQAEPSRVAGQSGTDFVVGVAGSRCSAGEGRGLAALPPIAAWALPSSLRARESMAESKGAE